VFRLGRLHFFGVRFLGGVLGFVRREGWWNSARGRSRGGSRCVNRRWCWCWSRSLGQGHAGKHGGDQGGGDFLHDVKSLNDLNRLFSFMVTDPAFFHARC
jgi:hypothetical protein